MKRIDIKLSLPVVAPLLDVLRDTAESLRDTLAAPMRLTDLEADFREFWHEELLQGQNAEVNALLELFNDDFYTHGTIALDESNALSVLRGAAALRLQVRNLKLRTVSDEALEGGKVAPESLPEEPRKALLAYVFLATLQELVIEHLGESILRGPEPEPEAD